MSKTIQERLDLNDEIIRDFGYNEQGELSIITEDLDKALEYCKKIVPEVQRIYSFDSAFKCDICHTIKDIDKQIIDEETGETVCTDCYKG